MSGSQLRCAIYTRKSSEEGLKQDFNSLDAQREACAAYVLSQAGEGWIAISTIYDDGGYSGGNMERPALKALMVDIERRLVDIVVVYKVDRLTRSLTDFGRIVETFDAKGVSFVSVTQAFNTTTSMGRLTLNVLLSFAQFEREVTGERIRDKIAASKAKGFWMGGNVPMGYEADGRTLKIDEAEADIVRNAYRRYLELGSVHELQYVLARDGVHSKVRISSSGQARGGGVIGRGALFHMLSNRTYLGQIPHKGVFHPGLHPPIISQETFDAVQKRLQEGAAGGRKERRRAALQYPLTGLLKDAQGALMSPVTAKGSKSQRYRYYVSSPLQLGQRAKADGLRVSAPAIELLVADCVRYFGIAHASEAGWEQLRSQIVGVAFDGFAAQITFPAEAVRNRSPHHDYQVAVQGKHVIITTPPIVKRGGRTQVVSGKIEPSRQDPALLRALARAESWKSKLLTNSRVTMAQIGSGEGLAESYVQRVLRLAFLAPDLKRSILDGRQPIGLSLERFMRNDLPLGWEEQRRLFA